MSEDFNDFFDQHAGWTTSNDPDAEPSYADAPQGDGAEPPRPPRSRRDLRAQREQRRKKRTRRIVAAVVCVAVIALLGVGVAAGARKIGSWVGSLTSSQSSIEDYDTGGHGSVQFTVKSGESVEQIAQGLAEADIVKSADAFTSTVSANQLTLYPGTYDMKYQMKASAAAAILSDQGNAHGFLEVRPGETVSDVLAAAEEITGISADGFQQVIDAKGEGILPAEASGSFEGWLEPGSYDVADETDPSAILKQMVDARVAKLDDLGVAAADRERILTMASIAEAEVNSTEYYGKVVRVIENRLADGMTLGMDTTVAYGLGISANELTNDQLADASNPYNTRVNHGLPPTPISNPGDSALEAAINPPEGNWLYFVTVNLQTGETKFTDSDAEFQQYVQEYKTNNPEGN